MLHQFGLEKFERAQVDGRVRKHAHQADGETAVGSFNGSLAIHLLGRLDDEGVAVQTPGNRFALHSEFQSINWVDAESTEVSDRLS